jgi:hypothetical protein
LKKERKNRKKRFEKNKKSIEKMKKRENWCHRLGIIPQGSQQRMRQAHSWYWCGMISLAMACKFDLISAECIEIVICFCRCSPCYLTLDIYCNLSISLILFHTEAIFIWDLTVQ